MEREKNQLQQYQPIFSQSDQKSKSPRVASLSKSTQRAANLIPPDSNNRRSLQVRIYFTMPTVDKPRLIRITENNCEKVDT